MHEYEHKRWCDVWDQHRRPMMYSLLVDFFCCPLCRHTPLRIIEAYYDDFYRAVFRLFCNNCRCGTEYTVGDDSENIKKTRRQLMKIRALAIEILTAPINNETQKRDSRALILL